MNKKQKLCVLRYCNGVQGARRRWQRGLLLAVRASWSHPICFIPGPEGWRWCYRNGCQVFIFYFVLIFKKNYLKAIQQLEVIQQKAQFMMTIFFLGTPQPKLCIRMHGRHPLNTRRVKPLEGTTVYAQTTSSPGSQLSW